MLGEAEGGEVAGLSEKGCERLAGSVNQCELYRERGVTVGARFLEADPFTW